MGLKADLKSAFEDTLESGGKIKDLAKAITDSYEDACKAGTDSLNNSYQFQLFPLVAIAIEGAFTLCLNAKTVPLNLMPVSVALVACWTPALLKLPATHPAMSQVIIGNVVVSIPVPVLPIVGESDNTDAIVNAFFNMFTMHAKTLNFLYTGLSLPTPTPVPLALPVPLFTIT